MKITVLLFGPQARRVGRRDVVIECPGDSATGAQLRAALANAAPALADTLPASRLAVNHAYIGEEDPIHPGDEVALIGMVSGG